MFRCQKVFCLRFTTEVFCFYKDQFQDYLYSLTKKDRNVKTHFSYFFQKLEKGLLKTSMETKPFLFPYINSIADFAKLVNTYFFRREIKVF